MTHVAVRHEVLPCGCQPGTRMCHTAEQLWARVTRALAADRTAGSSTELDRARATYRAHVQAGRFVAGRQEVAVP